MLQLHEFTHYKHLMSKYLTATNSKEKHTMLHYLRLYEVKLAREYGKETVYSLIRYTNK